MSTATGLILTKRFTYRGNTDEEVSNRYWLTGPPPSDEISWEQLASSVMSHERHCYTAGTRNVSASGYNDNDPHAHAVWSIVWPTTGAAYDGDLVIADAHPYAGDQAGLVQWKLKRLSSKGKPIFLRKYFHDGGVSATNRDSPDNATYQAYSDFASAMVSGVILGNRLIRSQTQDEQIAVAAAYPYVTTRTLKRRGKRPLPKA